jgi:hypothetical protein
MPPPRVGPDYSFWPPYCNQKRADLRILVSVLAWTLAQFACMQPESNFDLP